MKMIINKGKCNMEQNRREFLAGAAAMGKLLAVDEIDMGRFDFTCDVKSDADAQTT